MGWSVQIVKSGGATFEFSISPRFSISKTQSFVDNFARDSSDNTVRLTGIFEGQAPDPRLSAFEQYVSLLDFVDSERPVTIRIFLDGILKREFRPSDFDVGPFVSSLSDSFTPGEYSNYVEFDIGIFASARGRRDAPKGSPLPNRVETDWWNKRLIQKRWVMEARDTEEMERLRNLELDLVPYAKSVVHHLGENTMGVSFEFDPTQDETRGYRRWSETVTFRAPGRGIGWITHARGRPTLWVGPIEPGELVVEGAVESLDPFVFLPEFPSVNEDFLDKRESVIHSPPTLVTPQGLYSRSYRLVYRIADILDVPNDILLTSRPPRLEELKEPDNSTVPGFK